MEKYLKYFYEIASIPHGSGNTKMISDYLVKFAQKRELYVRQDEMNNVVIKKPAHKSYVNHEPIALQGHIDMVAVKESVCFKDMKEEGLDLYIDGDYLKAAGTSLGGDDGIAVAYMLDLLDSDYEMPEIQCIFTVDEEVGMVGATGFNPVDITANKMINLDQEKEGEFIVGCAGGATFTFSYVPNKGVYTGSIYEISVSGLLGGHSGIDINQNRGCAIKLVAEELCKLSDKIRIQLIDINGGTADNVIPNDCVARIMLTDECDNPLMEKEVMSLNGQDYYFGSLDVPEMAVLNVKKCGSDSMIALDSESTNKLLKLVSSIPYGVLGMCEADESMVETSNNIGRIISGDDDIKCICMCRSNDNRKKDAIVFELCKLAQSFGASYEISGSYSGWQYAPVSAFRDKMVEIYEKMYLCKPTVMSIHAGLEGGIFCDKIAGLECVSIGPDINDIHSVNEALSLTSAQRCFEYVKEVLRQFI